MKTTKLIIVGGFLGAGKTTLLWEASQRIINNGNRVGLVTNDQAPELVDTALLSHKNVNVVEVSGSCFCCNFNGFIDALKQVRANAQADVIIAEPVGSCTDLSATIIQPLKDNMRQELLVAPLSVLADPVRLSDILNGGTAGLHPSAAYIFRKQLEESDIIVITKADLLNPKDLDILKTKVKQNFPFSEVVSVSAITGAGVDEWLKEVMNRTNAGKHIVDVDYSVYAEGEAVLGWLNSTVLLNGIKTDWENFALNFLQGLGKLFDSKELPVGHVKIIMETEKKFLVGNITGHSDTISIRGSIGESSEVRLIINARVGTEPTALEQFVREVLDTTTKGQITKKIVAWRCLSPGYPNPTHRYSHVVSA
jgi:Ni2+-binding GTPase involved in maturation of urease and hydrogenase